MTLPRIELKINEDTGTFYLDLGDKDNATNYLSYFMYLKDCERKLIELQNKRK